jgi:rubrerythrin
MALQIDFSKLDAQDVLDIAIQVEEEAMENYEQLVAWMTRYGNTAAADFFSRMARMEERHRDQIAAQRHVLFGATPPRHTDVAIWEVEQPDWSEIERDLSLEKAFDLGMDSERRAGAYYEEALEYAEDPKVIELFRELRDAEKHHMRMLREHREQLLGESDA